jgi:apolipoprotein N-acyltransferase
VNDALFARAASAAQAGARVVSFTEASTLLLPAEEGSFVERARNTAKSQRIELIVAYIMPTTIEPLHYENRLRWFSPDGEERLSYLKHHPVPGEPATPGAAPAPVFATDVGLASAALCYDYDFPALARSHARGGAGLVVVPSSDWRGIDPIHSEMAAMRAIEGGFSVLRTTRWGLSAGIDAHGRLRAASSTNETKAPFVLVSLPTNAQPTPYGTLGNFVLVPLVMLLLGSLWALVGLASADSHHRRARFDGSRSAARCSTQ